MTFAVSRRDMITGVGMSVSLAALAGACAPKVAEKAHDLSMMDAVKSASLVRKGEISALEVVESAIKRAEAINPKLNAIVSDQFDWAMEQAAKVQSGPLIGVPTFIKDLLDWKGVPTKFGSRAFADYIAQESSPYVNAWIDAGTIPLGKSSTPEMGLISSTEPLLHGPTRNPWNLEHSPGGSSGGAGALVAARVVPIAQASDGGGSIRIPASCCHLFGFKPSRDRQIDTGNSNRPAISISVRHALTHTVRDSMAMFMATERIGDEALYPAMQAVTAPISRSLKIGLVTAPGTGANINPEIVAATEATAKKMVDLGHDIIPYSLPFDVNQFSEAFIVYWAAGAAHFVKQASAVAGIPPGPEILEPWTLTLAKRFSVLPDEALGEAVMVLQQADAAYNAMFDDIDILLTPTLGGLPPKIGEQAPDIEPDLLSERINNFACFTPVQNAAGAPAMSVPLAMSETGLPIGIHFSARRGEDRTLFELAYQLEEAFPWADKIAPHAITG